MSVALRSFVPMGRVVGRMGGRRTMASTNKAGTNAAPNVKKNQEHAQKHNFNLSHGKDLPTYMKWGKRDQNQHVRWWGLPHRRRPQLSWVLQHGVGHQQVLNDHRRDSSSETDPFHTRPPPRVGGGRRGVRSR